ncbi:MAG: hypothetical protein ABI151_16680 [Chitinophagaceae bacterium]
MTKTLLFISFLSFLLPAVSCVNSAPVLSINLPFESQPESSPLSPGLIDEASGIAESRTGKGFLWVEQDSGNPPEIYRLGKDAVLINKVTLKGIHNRDWEDLVISKGPKNGINYLYLAETGDNISAHNAYSIFRFPEPADDIDTVSSFDIIRFQYPDAAHDAEAILVDHETKDIYIITKRDAKSRIYKMKYPQDLVNNNQAEMVGELPFNFVVSAALSADSKEIILKTYTKLYYWRKSASEKIEETLSNPALVLGYQSEPQGEAICFSGSGAGFFTLGEKPFTVSSVQLNYYKRR